MLENLNGKKYKTGIVLSGGGVRGFAHLGILKALNESGIYPEIISGTSAGAIAGALYADGRTPDEIMCLFAEIKFFKYLELMIPRKGLLKMTGLARLINENLRAKFFEELKIPLIVCATDFSNGKCKYFSTGELYKKVLASATVPVLFPPINIENCHYIDGGILDNFPTLPIHDITENIIGINVNPLGFQSDFTSLMNIAERAFHLSFASSVRLKQKHCFIFLEPEALKEYKLLDFSKSKEIFNAGYEYAVKYFEKNQDKIIALKN